MIPSGRKFGHQAQDASELVVATATSVVIDRSPQVVR
jgi:hypothetical protein